MAFVVLGVVALDALYAGESQLTGWGAGRDPAAAVPTTDLEHRGPTRKVIHEICCAACLEICSCDQAECELVRGEKHEGDPVRIESCTDRFDRKVPRQARRCNRKYGCNHDTCELVDFGELRRGLWLKYMTCKDRNMIHKLGQRTYRDAKTRAAAA